MHHNGHFGVSMILCAPFLLVSLLSEMYIIGGVLCLSMLLFSSTPDIDLQLPFFTHRGFTHTVQFAVLLGLLMGVISFFGLTYVDTQIVSLSQLLQVTVISSILQLSSVIFVGSTLGIIFHLIGDIFTPTGVNLFSKANNYGYSLHICKANSKFGNESAMKLGFMSIGLTFIYGFTITQTTTSLLVSVGGYLLGYSVIVGLWLTLVKFKG